MGIPPSPDKYNKTIIKLLEKIAENSDKQKFMAIEDNRLQKKQTRAVKEQTTAPSFKGNEKLFTSLTKEAQGKRVGLGSAEKFMVRMMNTQIGLMAVKSAVYIRENTKMLFSTVSANVNSIMQKAFGTLLNEIQPFINILTATGKYIKNMIVSPMFKIIGSLLKWGAGAIRNRFRQKKLNELKKKRKQTSNADLPTGSQLNLFDSDSEKMIEEEKKKGLRKRIKDTIGKVGQKIQDTWISVTTKIKEGVVKVWKGMKSLIKDTAKAVWDTAVGIVKTAIEILGETTKAIGGLVGTAASFIPFIGPIIGPLIGKFFGFLLFGGALFAVGKGIFGSVTLMLKKIWGKFNEYFPEVGEWLIKKYEILENKVKGVITWFKEQMLDMIKSIPGIIIKGLIKLPITLPISLGKTAIDIGANMGRAEAAIPQSSKYNTTPDISKILKLEKGVNWKDVDPELKKRITTVAQKHYDKYGEPLQINSGHRSELKNRLVGGADESYHLKGLAVDLQSEQARKMKKELAQEGLISPVAGEPWHWEMVETRKNTDALNKNTAALTGDKGNIFTKILSAFSSAFDDITNLSVADLERGIPMLSDKVMEAEKDKAKTNAMLLKEKEESEKRTLDDSRNNTAQIMNLSSNEGSNSGGHQTNWDIWGNNYTGQSVLLYNRQG